MEHLSCPACSQKYAGAGGKVARMPTILPCVCRICKECALREEAKAQQPAGGAKEKIKGKGKGKGKEKAYMPAPCMNCKKLSTTPVAQLPFDIVLMKQIVGNAAAHPPPCDFCEEKEATKFCAQCVKNKWLCDGCHENAHTSSKKQGHAPTPAHEHLASAGGGGAVAQVRCNTHSDEILKHFCDTCKALVCGSCAIHQHNGHKFTTIEQAEGVQRGVLDQLLAEVVVTRGEAIAATTAIQIIRGELEGNRDAALKIIDEGFNRLLRAIKQRREMLKQLVNGAYTEKDDVLNKQITALEAIDIDSEAAMQLIEATLAAATSVEVLERAPLFAAGLTQFKQHGVPLKENCVSKITIRLKQSFEESAEAILAIGVLDADATDPTASAAEGKGLTVANMGEVSEFVVTAVEVGTGKQRSVGGDTVVVRLVVHHNGEGDEEGAAEGGGGSGGGVGGGGGGGAAAKPKGGKRKRGGGSGGKGRASKKSKGGASSAGAGADVAPANVDGTVVDNANGTYSCRYTPTKKAGAKFKEVRQLEVLLNDEHIVGSPFAVEVLSGCTDWVFGSVPDGNIYKLSEGGAVATHMERDDEERGIVADGLGCAPLTVGVHYWELEIVKKEDRVGSDPGRWWFGVCRPGIDLSEVNGYDCFYDHEDTWMMLQDDCPDWLLSCETCEGTGMTLKPPPKFPAGSRVGLLLDLDNGGTLTVYLKGKPCGTIAEGLVGPLLPCISMHHAGMVVKIHGGLAPPQ